RPLDLDREGDEPAVGGSGDGGGKDAGGTVLKAAGELACGFVGLQDADPGELDVLAIGHHLDGPGGEPAGLPAAPLPLPLREPDRTSLASPGSRVGPVLEGPGQ